MPTELVNRPSFVIRIIQAALISMSLVAVGEIATAWFVNESFDLFTLNPVTALLIAFTFAIPLVAAYGVAKKWGSARYLAGLLLAFALVILARGLFWNFHYWVMNFSSLSDINVLPLAWTVYGMAAFGLVVVALPSLILSKDVRDWFRR